MITIEVSISEANAIRYAVNEMANRRHENSIDYSQNKEMSNAARMEALQLRALAQRVSDKIKEKTT